MKVAASIALCLLAGAHSAYGQSKPPVTTSRGYVVLGGAYLTGSHDFDSQSSLRTNAEDGSYEVDYPLSGGPGFAVSGGFRIWKRLGLRLGGSRFSVDSPATLNASVPHPFFFNRMRTTSASIDGLSHQELSINFSALGMIPVARRGLLSVYAGPSWIQVKQGTVTDFTYSDTYPYDSITFNQASTSITSGSKVGLGAGADFSFFFSKTVGVALTAQFARTTIALKNGSGDLPIDAGGASIGFGVVFRIP